MLKKTLFITALSLSMISFAATPVSGPYIKGFAGLAGIPDNLNASGFSRPDYYDGYNVGGLMGYKSGPLHYNLEGTYIRGKVKHYQFNSVQQTALDSKTDVMALMLNIGYDFEDLNDCLAPFIDVGIGYARPTIDLNSNNPSSTSYRQSENVFAYQGRIGITYNFSENYALDLSYRYFRTTNNDTFNKDYQAHLGELGVIYRFDKL